MYLITLVVCCLKESLLADDNVTAISYGNDTSKWPQFKLGIVMVTDSVLPFSIEMVGPALGKL